MQLEVPNLAARVPRAYSSCMQWEVVRDEPSTLSSLVLGQLGQDLEGEEAVHVCMKPEGRKDFCS